MSTQANTSFAAQDNAHSFSNVLLSFPNSIPVDTRNQALHALEHMLPLSRPTFTRKVQNSRAPNLCLFLFISSSFPSSPDITFSHRSHSFPLFTSTSDSCSHLGTASFPLHIYRPSLRSSHSFNNPLHIIRHAILCSHLQLRRSNFC